MEESKYPYKVEYIPPSPHQIEVYCRQACHELGFHEAEVIQGFTDFMKLVISIKTRHLNQ